MEQREHSIRGASSAKRWMECPGCINAIEALPQEERSTTSEYAAEGQAAHNLAQLGLTGGDPLSPAGGMCSIDNTLGATVHDDDGNEHEVTADMIEAVNVYLVEIFAQREAHPNAECHVEQKLDVTWLRPDLFGTADHILAEPFGDLIVTDYKHGRGVVVEVESNEQLMYYALGALKEAGGPDEFENVKIVLVQPRAMHADGPVRRWEIGAQALWDWGHNELAPAYDRTLDPEAPRNAGAWCRFCPVMADCEATRALVQREAAIEFSDAPLDPAKDMPALPGSVKDLAQAMNAIPVIDAWCKAVAGQVDTILKRGEAVPGFKLVRGRSNRKWKDAAKVEKVLKGKRGVKTEDIYKKTLLGPSPIEKLRGVGKAWVAKYAEKPEGALTVAPESDAREAVAAPAITDFAGLPTGDEGVDDDIFK